jgi:hypothetical protein
VFWYRRVDADSTLNHPRLIPCYVENAIYLQVGRYVKQKQDCAIHEVTYVVLMFELKFEQPRMGVARGVPRRISASKIM